uniref:Protein MEMO1 n=1 Tax=Parascaris univalens TaxID=6257 RepID=A0A915B4L1_PARUN
MTFDNGLANVVYVKVLNPHLSSNHLIVCVCLRLYIGGVE